MHALLAFLDPDQTAALIELVGAVAMLVATRYLVPWLRAKADAATDQRRHALYVAAVERLESAIGPAVAATERTVARKLRAAEPQPGNLTPEQASTALSHAISGVLESFGEAELDRVASGLGVTRAQLESVITTRIEAELDARKGDGTAS